MSKKKLTVSANQAAFNAAYRGLQFQNWEESVNGYKCATFNGLFGRHCSLGWIAPAPPCSRSLADQITRINRHLSDLVGQRPNRLLLFDLLRAHDTARNPQERKRWMEKVAEGWNLTIPDPWKPEDEA